MQYEIGQQNANSLSTLTGGAGLQQARCPIHDLPLSGPFGQCPVMGYLGGCAWQIEQNRKIQGSGMLRPIATEIDIRDHLRGLRIARRRHNWRAFAEAIAILGGIGLAMWVWVWVAANGGPQ